jgi:hypothetical protein
MVVIYHSLEACSILLFGTNFMWDEQSSVLITHGIVSAATTASVRNIRIFKNNKNMCLIYIL